MQTLLDTSKRNAISEVVEIGLSKNEDSVTSLAVAHSTRSSVTAFAGINSSEADQLAGKNEHLRSFKLGYPLERDRSAPTTGTEKPSPFTGKTEALSQVSLFKPSSAQKKETYQRILRLSPVKEDERQRVAAIASGLAVESEIVTFLATPAPQRSDELTRIALGKNEAADLDIISQEVGGVFLLAYCTNSEVYTSTISITTDGFAKEPIFRYGIPAPDAFASSSTRPTFRSLRYLSEGQILLLQNKPQRSGAELLILSVNDSSPLSTVTLQKRLNNSMKAAVGLDVCQLPPGLTDEREIVVAVAGQDGSLEILTLEYTPLKEPSKFRPYTVLKDVHPAPITKICFSNFPRPTTSSRDEPKAHGVKLASVSVGQTVVVHTLPLEPSPRNNSETPRYVLRKPSASKVAENAFSVFMAVLVIGLSAFLLQAFIEIRGAAPSTLGAADWLSPRMKELLARPYMFADSASMPAASEVPMVGTVKAKLQDLISQQSSPDEAKAIIVRDDGGGELSTEVRADAEIVEQERLRKWEEMEEHERESWRTKLSRAGHWTADQGESILKGVFFSELAGVVGDMIRNA